MDFYNVSPSPIFECSRLHGMVKGVCCVVVLQLLHYERFKHEPPSQRVAVHEVVAGAPQHHGVMAATHGHFGVSRMLYNCRAHIMVPQLERV